MPGIFIFLLGLIVRGGSAAGQEAEDEQEGNKVSFLSHLEISASGANLGNRDWGIVYLILAKICLLIRVIEILKQELSFVTLCIFFLDS